ncbi:MAG: ATP-binding cassette domain-containing protein [Halioglobus sp.]|nr:ATP-binding cassette domain-containing protein [Halioglobus sp.]
MGPSATRWATFVDCSALLPENPAIVIAHEIRAYHMSAIAIRQLGMHFAGAADPVLCDVSFTLAPAENLSLLGPSGCGKTTLLRLLMGLQHPTAGSIDVAAALLGSMSYVFQEPRLVPWRSCLENVLLPLELTGKNDDQGRELALALLQQCGLTERLQHFPGQLSGGMQMRVALARALVTEPKLVLLDEPFAALDERSRFRMQDLLLELRVQLGLQYIFVTHSIAEAVYLGDRILLLDARGRVRDWRRIQFPARDQSVKQTPVFNDLVQAYSELFASMEGETDSEEQ